MGDHTSTADAAARVIATPAAEAAIRELVAERGKLMFFQSGGCCDGSLPICFDLGEFVLNDRDVLLGTSVAILFTSIIGSTRRGSTRNSSSM